MTRESGNSLAFSIMSQLLAFPEAMAQQSLILMEMGWKSLLMWILSLFGFRQGA